mgnify:CR=1 FL=1
MEGLINKSIKKYNMSYIFIILTFSFSCNFYEDNNSSSLNHQDSIYYYSLPTILDSVVIKFQNDYSVIYHREIYPDKLKSVLVENSIKQLNPRNMQYKNLLLKLKDVVNDSLNISITKILRPTYEVIFNDRLNIGQKNQIGIINLSPVVFETENFGCYYLAFQCGNNCGIAYIIFLKKEDSYWRISKTVNVWNASL